MSPVIGVLLIAVVAKSVCVQIVQLTVGTFERGPVWKVSATLKDNGLSYEMQKTVIVLHLNNK